METTLEKKKTYNFDISINSEKILTIYDIHKPHASYSEEQNDAMYELKVDIFKDLLKEQIFLDVIDSLIKIYKEDFDFIPLLNFKSYMTEINDESKEAQKKYLLQRLIFNVIIKFDEIKIVNSRNGEGDLKDFYVRFGIVFIYNNTGFKCRLYDSNLYGRRATRYDFELVTGYIHSHLPSRTNFDDFNSFCLGAGPIYLVLSDLSNESRTFNMVKFKGFLYQIKSYLAWESLEGGPYIHLSGRSNVANNLVKNNVKCFFHTPSYYHDFTEHQITQIKGLCSILIKELINNQYINVNLKKNLIKNINDIEIEIPLDKEMEFVSKLGEIFTQVRINNNFNTTNLDIFAIKRNDKYYEIDSTSATQYDRRLENQYLFKFKGNRIMSKVLLSESSERNSVRVLNPYFKRKLLSIIKNIIIKNERRGKENSEEKSKNYRVKTYEDTSIYL